MADLAESPLAVENVVAPSQIESSR
jgi:hypothetical protein